MIRHSKPLGVVIATGCFFAMLMSANLATPLYGRYSERFGFSPAVPALIFATYVVVLVPSLLVFGQVSDAFGRRPYVCVYVMVAGPVIGIGIVAAGVSLHTAVSIFAAVTGAGAMAVAAWHLRNRGADEPASA